MNESRASHKFILLGASRGLGQATFQALQKKYPAAEFLLVSRKIENGFQCDFSKSENLPRLMNEIEKFSPTHIVYLAAGGPYGNFHEKKWNDHLWSLQVSFLFPAQLLHSLMQKPPINLKKFVCVGSAIAENKADPQAASYCAAKHALRGLISTIQAENKSAFKVDLFSPGYMETDLLPAQSWPRQQGLADSAENVALALIDLLN
jgi:short-subunit dehydrogenase